MAAFHLGSTQMKAYEATGFRPPNIDDHTHGVPAGELHALAVGGERSACGRVDQLIAWPSHLFPPTASDGVTICAECVAIASAGS